VTPEAIYGLLWKHFDTVPCSPLPLADFYTTLPEKCEGAFDYWLRLNRAVDLAIERLKDQGKSLDCPSTEVARIFIRNSPSKELAMTFRSKTVDTWSAHEVQDILNVTKVQEKVSVNKIDVSQATVLPSECQDSSQARSTESSTLEHVISMLEKVLLQRPTATAARPSSSRQSRPQPPFNVTIRLCFQCHSPDHSRHACPDGKRPTSHQQLDN